MADVFLSVVNMSIAAGYAAIAVLIIRFFLILLDLILSIFYNKYVIKLRE